MTAKLQTKPCQYCGQNMIEDGDGWCSAEPGSEAGFYSAHWACTHESKDGQWIAVAGRSQYRYTTRKRAESQAEYLRQFNPGLVVTVQRG